MKINKSYIITLKLSRGVPNLLEVSNMLIFHFPNLNFNNYCDGAKLQHHRC